uniref:Uncharacterized protein n=1 Tax=Cucumis sativus TaxID=3659 RepID=A0A0A0KLB7_CUCSA
MFLTLVITIGDVVKLCSSDELNRPWNSLFLLVSSLQDFVEDDASICTVRLPPTYKNNRDTVKCLEKKMGV